MVIAISLLRLFKHITPNGYVYPECFKLLISYHIRARL